MKRRRQQKGKKAGLPPGTPIFTGQQRMEVTDLTVMTYSPTELKVSKAIKDIVLPVTDGVLWIDIRGLHETELLKDLGGRFDIHPLALEDIVDIYQRPKFDNYEDGFLLLMESYTFFPEEMRLVQEQVSVFCGNQFVLSFQEDAKDCFDNIHQRIQNSQGRIRKYNADYLAYALADTVVDKYFIAIESISDVVEKLESEIATDPSFETKNKIHAMKRVVLDLRKGVAPFREALSLMMRSDSKIISDSTRPYLQDLYGNVLQSLEMIDTSRDILSGLQDLYLAEISYKMNKVIQTLTIVSTIFIPLTFVAGVYGMNFKHMPGLDWEHGFFLILGFMFVVTMVLLFWFHRRRWL